MPHLCTYLDAQCSTCSYTFFTTEVRCAESAKIRGKYQDRIPVSWMCSVKSVQEEPWPFSRVDSAKRSRLASFPGLTIVYRTRRMWVSSREGLAEMIHHLNMSVRCKVDMGGENQHISLNASLIVSAKKVYVVENYLSWLARNLSYFHSCFEYYCKCNQKG